MEGHCLYNFYSQIAIQKYVFTDTIVFKYVLCFFLVTCCLTLIYQIRITILCKNKAYLLKYIIK